MGQGEQETYDEYEQTIIDTCKELAGFLIEKNRSYGKSILNPVRIFSKSDALEGINIRIDDKLSRLLYGREYAGEDTLKDLTGYYIIREVYKKLEKK